MLGWTLVHFLWQGTALAIALGMALAVVPRRFARVRYALGCSTLALMLAVPTATAWRLSDPQRAGLAVVRARAARRLSCPMPAPAADIAGTPARDVDGVARSERSADPAATVPVRTHRSVRGHAVDRRRVDDRRAALLAAPRRRLVARPRLAFVGARAAAREWQEVVARLKSRLGVMRSVRLLESARVSVPIVVGWIKPTLHRAGRRPRRTFPERARGGARTRARAHPASRLSRQPAAVGRRDAALLPPRRLVGVARRPRRARALLRRSRGEGLRRRGALRAGADGHRS